MLLGGDSLTACALPSIIATWLTTLLIYGYSRRLSCRPLGGLAAQLVYATTGMVL